MARMNRWGVVAAGAVHAYTGLGLVCAYFAYAALRHGSPRAFFAWLAAAVFIDSTDGALARTLKVREVLPEFDGRKLDDIIDYLTYVLLPMLAVLHWSLLPANLEWLVMLPLVASAYGFSQARAKTEDSFVGFPSYWNVVVFYLAALGWPAPLNATILVGLSLMVFVPIHYIYPSRARWLLGATLFLAGVWGVLVLTAIAAWGTQAADRAAAASLFFPIYYMFISLVHHRRTRAQERAVEAQIL